MLEDGSIKVGLDYGVVFGMAPRLEGTEEQVYEGMDVLDLERLFEAKSHLPISILIKDGKMKFEFEKEISLYDFTCKRDKHCQNLQRFLETEISEQILGGVVKYEGIEDWLIFDEPMAARNVLGWMQYVNGFDQWEQNRKINILMEKDQQGDGVYPRLTPVKQSVGFYFNCADNKIKFS